MPTPLTIVDPPSLRKLSVLLGLCTLVASVVSFSGWVFDIPRLTSWGLDEISIQPNTAVLIALASMAGLLVPYGRGRFTLLLGGFVALGGALNLLQYMAGTDFGFNHQLLFGREWGQGATMTPGRFGPPASFAFVLIGVSLMLLRFGESSRRYVPTLALIVVLLLAFSLLLAWLCSASARARALPVQRCILAQARFGALGGMRRCGRFTDALWATSPARRRFGPRQAAFP